MMEAEDPTTPPFAVGDVVTGYVWVGRHPARQRQCIVDRAWFNEWSLSPFWAACGRFRTQEGHWSKHPRIIQRPWGTVTAHEPTEIERLRAEIDSLLKENNWMRGLLAFDSRERPLDIMERIGGTT